MEKAHVILLLLWTGYCVVHSILANHRIKSGFRLLMGNGYKYYRLFYSVFAAASLLLLLVFHFSIETIPVFYPGNFKYLGLPVAAAGLIIMAICIKKYFYELSGISVFQKQHPAVSPQLQQGGLHKRVRHPLYLGTLIFIYGLFLFFPYLNNLVAVAIITIYTFIGIRLEENKLLLEYGEQYLEYKKRVPMLIPKLWSK